MDEKSNKNNFVAPERIQVIIPYSDLEKMVHMAQEMEVMQKQLDRIEEQYVAIRGMFSQCLEIVQDIKAFVKD